jgi:hypothetical protein
MTVQAITDLAVKHLYAGELLRKVAQDFSPMMEHMSDEQVVAAQKLRELLIAYAEAELIVTGGLCDVAAAEQEKAA